MKVTAAVCVSATPSPVAVKTEEPAVEDFTVKEIIPRLLDWPEVGEMVSDVPRLEASATALPGTGLPSGLLSVTLTVQVAVPLAVTELDAGVTVELTIL